MAKRCDNCVFWIETVFIGQSASGYGCWEGVCQHPEVPRPRRDRHNLMLACPKFEEGAHPDSIAGCIERKAGRSPEAVALVRTDEAGVDLPDGAQR